MSLYIRYLLFFITFQFLSTSFASLKKSNESRLAEKLLLDYNTDMRPFDPEFNNKTILDVLMTLTQIISVKEKTQEMATSVYMQYYWTDVRLKWHPPDFENITIIRMPSDSIWTPRIVLENNKDGVFDVSLRTNVLINSNGKVDWLPPALYKSTCLIDVSLFPFDWQNCSMKFRSATYDRSEMEFVLKKYKIVIDQNAFQPNGEWDLVRYPVQVNNSPDDELYQDLTFYFIIRRRPQFYIMNLIIPCILLSSLSCLVFYLPSISCEKMTLSISVLLGETVFLFLIAQRMPETSLAVPLIAGYLLFCMTLVIVSVICSVIVCNIHYRSKTTHAMPGWVVWLFMEKLAPFLNVERPGVAVAEQEQEELKDDDSLPRRNSAISARRADRERSARMAISEQIFHQQAYQMGFCRRHIKGQFGLTEINNKQDLNSVVIPKVCNLPKSLKPAVEAICYIASHKKNEDELSQSEDDWGYVALIVDRALLWIYFIVFTLGSLAFFLQTVTADYPKEYEKNEM